MRRIEAPSRRVEAEKHAAYAAAIRARIALPGAAARERDARVRLWSSLSRHRALLVALGAEKALSAAEVVCTLLEIPTTVDEAELHAAMATFHERMSEAVARAVDRAPTDANVDVLREIAALAREAASESGIVAVAERRGKPS
jgi:hypothetical protein